MPSQQRAIQDKLLTNVSNKYVPEGYICESVLPLAMVTQDSGTIGYYHKEYLRIKSSIVSGSTKYPRVITTTMGSNSYKLTAHGLSDVITETDFKNYEEPYDARLDKTEDLTIGLYLEKEKALADVITDPTVITQNVTLSGTTQFNDYENSDPIGVSRTARQAVKAGCGKAPDLLVLSWEVADVLIYHPALIDFVKSSQAVLGGLTYAQLASAFQVPRILVGSVQYNAAEEGQADNLTPVWGKHMTFLCSPSTPGKRQVTAGYRLQRRGQPPRRIFRNALGNPPKSEEILCDDIYQWLIVDTTAAYLVEDAVG